jgi:hypothetical protein
VVVADGTELPADLVVVGVGVVPRPELVEQIGLSATATSSSTRTAGPATQRSRPPATAPPARADRGGAFSRCRARSSRARPLRQLCSVGSTAIPGCRGSGRIRPTCGCRSPGCRPATTSTWWRARHRALLVLYYHDGRLLAVNAVYNPVEYMVVRKALTNGIADATVGDALHCGACHRPDAVRDGSLLAQLPKQPSALQKESRDHPCSDLPRRRRLPRTGTGQPPSGAASLRPLGGSGSPLVLRTATPIHRGRRCAPRRGRRPARTDGDAAVAVVPEGAGRDPAVAGPRPALSRAAP